jgi:signal transduction histidine kinase
VNTKRVLAAWSVLALLACGERYAMSALGAAPMPLWRIVITQGLPWYAWAAVTPLIYRVAQRYPIHNGVRATTIAVHAIVCAITQSVYSAAYTIIAYFIGTIPRQFTPGRYFVITALGWIPVMTVVYAAVVGFFEWQAANARARTRELEAAALAAELAQAQLAALRMQLHPHFLFNALNTIAVLVGEEQRETAMQLLSRLGGVLRTVVRGDPARELPLREEVALIAEYLDIEQVRFADRLRIEWDLDAAALDHHVPVFVLQPLVENALRHGVGRSPLGGRLEVGADLYGGALRLWVLDDGPRGAPPAQGAGEESGQGIGLSNTRARLNRLYGDAASLGLEPLDGGGTRVVIRIPARLPSLAHA